MGHTYRDSRPRDVPLRTQFGGKHALRTAKIRRDCAYATICQIRRRHAGPPQWKRPDRIIRSGRRTLPAPARRPAERSVLCDHRRSGPAEFMVQADPSDAIAGDGRSWVNVSDPACFFPARQFCVNNKAGVALARRCPTYAIVLVGGLRIPPRGSACTSCRCRTGSLAPGGGVLRVALGGAVAARHGGDQ